MTITAPPARVHGPAGSGAPDPTATSSGPVPVSAQAAPASAPPAAPSLLVVGSALCILAALLLGFVAELTVVGSLRHSRDQTIAYSQLRVALARATAPVGQTDVNGHLLAPGTPIALLDIPAIGLHQTVLDGTTAGVLVSGPGHLRDSAFPGQAGVSVLMGRRATYGGPFRDIAKLRPGQSFTVTTGQGRSTYRVLDVRRAGDPLPPALAAGAGRMVLTTAGGAPYVPSGVVRVDADLTSTAWPKAASVLGASSISAAEQANASDTSALVRMAFWAQALLLAALAITWAWARWGRWQAWVVGVPVLLLLGLAVAGQAALLLPNLM